MRIPFIQLLLCTILAVGTPLQSNSVHSCAKLRTLAAHKEMVLLMVAGGVVALTALRLFYVKRSHNQCEARAGTQSMVLTQRTCIQNELVAALDFYRKKPYNTYETLSMTSTLPLLVCTYKKQAEEEFASHEWKEIALQETEVFNDITVQQTENGTTKSAKVTIPATCIQSLISPMNMNPRLLSITIDWRHNKGDKYRDSCTMPNLDTSQDLSRVSDVSFVLEKSATHTRLHTFAIITEYQEHQGYES